MVDRSYGALPTEKRLKSQAWPIQCIFMSGWIFIALAIAVLVILSHAPWLSSPHAEGVPSSFLQRAVPEAWESYWWMNERKAMHSGPFPSLNDDMFHKVDAGFSHMTHNDPDDVTGCERVSENGRHWCEANVGKKAISNAKQHDEMQGRCKWKNVDAFKEKPNLILQTVPHSMLDRDSGTAHFNYETSQKLIDEHRNRPKGQEVMLSSCETEDSKREGETWHFIRLGPFVSHGGYNWHRFLLPDILNYPQVKGNITGFAFAPIDSHGTRIGNPPLHIHHMHSATTQGYGMWMKYWGGQKPPPETMNNPGEGGNDWEMDIHGDRECLKHQGGTDCLVKIVPQDYAQMINHKIHAFGDLNDVRPHNSSALHFYLQWSYLVTTQPRKLFGMGAILPNVHALSTDWYKDFVKSSLGKRYYEANAKSFVDDYEIPGDEDSIIWGTFRMPFPTKIHTFFIHTHHLFTHDMFLFKATPAQLGLNRPPLQLSRFYEALRLAPTGINISMIKKYLYNNLRSTSTGGEPLVMCRMNTNRFEEGPIGIMGNGNAHTNWEKLRIPYCTEMPVVTTPADTWTYVTLHGPVTDIKVPEVVQHTIWYYEYSAADEKDLTRPLNPGLHPLQMEFLSDPGQFFTISASLVSLHSRIGLDEMRDWLDRGNVTLSSR